MCIRATFRRHVPAESYIEDVEEFLCGGLMQLLGGERLPIALFPQKLHTRTHNYTCTCMYNRKLKTITGHCKTPTIRPQFLM